MKVDEAVGLWNRGKYRQVRIACGFNPLLYLEFKDRLGNTPFFIPSESPEGFLNTHKDRLMSKMIRNDITIKPNLKAQLEGLTT